MTPRAVHPVAWWTWGVLLGAAALRITNPLLNLLLIGSVWLVVAARRRAVPWAGSFGTFVRLGIAVLLIRLVLQTLFAPSMPGHVLFALPELELPSWAASLRLGGAVTAESLLQALYESLRLIGLLAAIGAANALADPYRLLRSLPGALYETGVALTVAVSLAPQAGAAAAQVRDARRLRGRPTTGLASVRGIALPVLEGALDRSVTLAASMDARGFGRRGGRQPERHAAARAASATGLLALAIGLYGLLDAGAPAGLGVPLLSLGAALMAGSMVGRGPARRTRYRPDPWGRPEWATVLSGVTVAAGIIVSARLGIDLSGSVQPLVVPALPLLPAAALLVAALPAVATPEPAP